MNSNCLKFGYRTSSSAAPAGTTTLILPFDADNGSTVFRDLTKRNTFTAQGGAVISNTRTKFAGCNSAYFPSTTARSTIKTTNALSSFGNNDGLGGSVHCDCWVNLDTAWVSGKSAYGWRATSLSPFWTDFGLIVQDNSTSGNCVAFYQDNSGSSVRANTGMVLALNTWYHIAVVRFGTAFRVWVNGVLKANISIGSSTLLGCNTVFNIGGNYSGYADAPLGGYISMFRFNRTAMGWTQAQSYSVPNRIYR